MSKIEELIKKLCPNGVEYKTIGELFDVKNGYTPSKNNKYFWENGNIPWFRMDDIRTNGNILNDATQHITELAIKNRKFPKDSLIVSTTATIGVHALIKCDFVCNQQLTCVAIKEKLKNDLNIKFCFYYFDIIDEQCKKIANQGGGMPIVSLEKMKKLVFPVPPLEVQCEIVHILDDFTLLSALLSAELKARREQFNYYRSKLFEKYLSDFVELDSIGDVTKLAGFEFTKYVKYSQEGNIIALRGLNVKDGRLVLNDIKYIDNSDFSKLERSKLYKNDLLYTYVGTVGQVGLVDQNNKYYLAPNVARIRINNSKVLPKFVMYFLQTPEFKVNQLDKLTGASSMKNITMTNIRKFKIPLPSIEEQERIVNILDRFDKYCNDISEGLPAEIEARQKQYEYYRDKLLTFKELKANE